MPWFPKAKSSPRKLCNNNETAAWRLQSADRINGPIQLLVAGRCLPTIDAVLPNSSHGLAHGGPVVVIAVHKALLPRMRNRDSATTRRQLPKYKGLSSMRVSVDGTNSPSCAGVHPRPMPHRPERFGPPDRIGFATAVDQTDAPKTALTGIQIALRLRAYPRTPAVRNATMAN